MEQVYNYVKVCNWAFPIMLKKRLSPAERFLFLYLLYRANASYWKSLNISVEKVMEETGISRRSLFSYKKRLINLGFLLGEEGWALNYNIFPQKTIIEKNEGIKKFAQSGVPARRFSKEEFDRYKY